jgi:hypothetical protein
MLKTLLILLLCIEHPQASPTAKKLCYLKAKQGKKIYECHYLTKLLWQKHNGGKYIKLSL